MKGEKKIFYLVLIEMRMYGPTQGSRTLPWAKCQIFLDALFICNNINTNLNEIRYIVKYSLFQTVIFIFFNFCEKRFEKIRKRKMAQGRAPSSKELRLALMRS